MADDRTPGELPEETKEKYRRWWSSRSPEERVRLRAMHGQPLTAHELAFLTDSEGFPVEMRASEAGEPVAVFHLPAGDPTAVFRLPDFLLSDETDEESR
jgi:hypothetical protein